MFASRVMIYNNICKYKYINSEYAQAKWMVQQMQPNKRKLRRNVTDGTALKTNAKFSREKALR